MTIIVETGAIVANSNSYVSGVDFVAYALARGTTIPLAAQELSLVLAMDYLETLHFIGTKFTSTQSLQWPRANAKIDGYSITTSTIPAELVKAQNEVALAIYNGNNPLQDAPRKVIKEKIDTLEITYSNGSSSVVVPTKVIALLAKLIAGGGSASFIVSKA